MDTSIYDLDGDGHVTTTEILLFFPHFGRRVGDPLYNPACDFDGDGVIGIADYNLLYRAYLEEWRLVVAQVSG